MADLNSPLTPIVGPKTAKALAAAFSMESVGDLLRHYPRRYLTRSVLSSLSDLQVGDYVTVMAEVKRVEAIPSRQSRDTRSRKRSKSRLHVDVTDGRSDLQLTFFNQMWRKKDLQPGVRGLFSGKVGVFRGRRQLTHPDYLVNPQDAGDGIVDSLTSSIIPVYPATASVPSWAITNSVSLALAVLSELDEPLPPALVADQGMLAFDTALRSIHKPKEPADWQEAQRRLKYDEALVMQTVLAKRRLNTASLAAKPREPVAAGLAEAFDYRLPFELTQGQLAVGGQIATDLGSANPMHRLLQGDVGSGKTMIALRSMLQVVDSGGQAVLLAPTEVLAQQHYRVITGLLGPLGQAGMLAGSEIATGVALLTASMSAPARRLALEEIHSGRAGIVVGTHALLQESVRFADLGLVVVDEQHRFGVEQRSALAARGDQLRPHVLVMTATPIPRTIAITVFGDLETSTLTDRPPGRQDVATHVVGENDPKTHMKRVWERARDEYTTGHQVFVVCPQISEDDPVDVSRQQPQQQTEDESEGSVGPVHSVSEVVRRLESGPLEDARIGALHGELSSEEKDEAMSRFVMGPSDPNGLDVLVSTTVVEVGVDIPDASMMVILDAERFGVSQLHQLRGRVGRGGSHGLCLLVTRTDKRSASRRRLESVAATCDGFELAKLDLNQRGEGDILGSLQSGRRSSLRLLSVLGDEETISRARSDATEVIRADSDLHGHKGLALLVAEFEGNEGSRFLEKG